MSTAATPSGQSPAGHAPAGPSTAPAQRAAALTAFVSIILHSATDQPGGEWMARRAERNAA